MPAFSLRRMIRERALWLLIACILAFFYRPLLGETFFFRDLYLLFFGKRALLSHALRAGELPLWDPLMHGGQPLLASPGNSALYPFNLLFVLLPSLTALNVHLVLQFVCCAVAAYFLARALGVSETGAFVSGAVYALCGYVLSSASLLVLMQALPWTPALLASVHLLVREGRKRWLVAAAIFGALPLLAGGADMAAMSLALAIAWIIFAGGRRRVFLAVAVVAFSAGLSLMQTLPAYEVIQHSSRGERGGYAAFVQWSVAPQRLPELVVPRFFGPTETLAKSDYWGGGYEYGYPYMVSIYFGTTVLLLALAGLMSKAIPRRGRIVLACFAAAGLILCLGGYLPFFHFLFEHVPLIGIFRFPVKALQLALVPIAALSGAGVDAATRRRLLVPAIITVAGLIIATAFQSSISRAWFEGTAHLTPAFAHAVIATLLFMAALLANRKIAIAAVVLLDLAIAGWRVNPYASRELFVTPPLAVKVRSLLGDGGRLYRTPDPYVKKLNVPTNENVWLAWWEIQLLSRYTAAAFGIPLIFHEDYDGLAPIQMRRMTDAIEKMAWPARLDVLSKAGATVIITPDVINSPDVERVEIVRSASGAPLYVYRNRAAHPLRFNPATRPPGHPATLRTLHRSLNEWSIEVNAPTSGQVIFNETFYPGWRMTVDGRETPQLSADFGLSAAAVPAGRHVVTKTYRPRLPLIGILGSLATAIALAFLRLSR